MASPAQFTASHRAATTARTGALLVFAANGAGFASWAARVPDIKQQLGLSPSGLGVLLLAISAGSLLGLPLAGRIAHRLGAARAVRTALAIFAPGLLLAAVAVTVQAPTWLVMAGLFLVGLGNGLWDVSQNLEGTVIEQVSGRSIMPWFHAAFSAGTVVAALVGALFVHLRVPILTHLILVVLVVAVLSLWGTSRFLSTVRATPTVPTSPHPRPDATPRTTPRSAWTEPRTLLIGLMVLAAAFAEGTANDWIAVAFAEGHHLGNTLGVLAMAVFLTFMTLGRVGGTFLLDHFGRVPVLRVLFGAALVGCVLVVFGTPWLAYVGAAIWGVGASLGFPVGISAAADDLHRAAARISVVSTIGYLAFLGGPPLLGFLGDHWGVLHALLVVGVMALLALLVVPAARPLPVDPDPTSSSPGVTR